MSETKVPVLITGGRGMLGDAFVREAHAFPRFDVRALGRDALDVRDAAAFAPHADWVRGGWVIHCAATVDVEGCARDPEAAHATIVKGTRNAATFASANGARLFYPQSFLTYDGASNPIPEDEAPRPLSLYGQMKLEAETIVDATCTDALVVVMAGFFGGEAGDKNFVGRILPAMARARAAGETVFKVGDRVWQPTWTADLAANSWLLIASGATGRYQMGAHGQNGADGGATFHDVAFEAARALGWTDFSVERVSAAAVASSEVDATRRPDRAVLSGTRLAAETLDMQRDWRATLHAYLTHPFFDRYRAGA